VNLRSRLRVNRPNVFFERSINMPEPRPNQNLLSRLPEHLSADLFANTTPVQLAADEVLFMAGAAGDGCYLVEDGLLKVMMVSRSGTEGILAFLGPSAIVGELSMIDGRPRSARIFNDWKRHELLIHFSGYYCLEDKHESWRVRGIRKNASRSLQAHRQASRTIQAVRAPCTPEHGWVRASTPAAPRSPPERLPAFPPMFRRGEEKLRSSERSPPVVAGVRQNPAYQWVAADK